MANFGSPQASELTVEGHVKLRASRWWEDGGDGNGSPTWISHNVTKAAFRQFRGEFDEDPEMVFRLCVGSLAGTTRTVYATFTSNQHKEEGARDIDDMVR